MAIIDVPALWIALFTGDTPMGSGTSNLLLEDGNNIELEPSGTAGGLLLLET